LGTSPPGRVYQAARPGERLAIVKGLSRETAPRWRRPAAAVLGCWGALFLLAGVLRMRASSQGAEVVLRGVAHQGRWVQPPEAREDEVSATVLYRGLLRSLTLPDGRALAARAVPHFTTQLPFPSRFPGFRLTISGELWVGAPGSTLKIAGPAVHELILEGRLSPGVEEGGFHLHPLPATTGWLPFTLRCFRPTPAEDLSLGLDVRVLDASGREHEVGGSALRPPHEDEAALLAARRSRGRALAVTGGLFLAVAFLLAGRDGVRHPARVFRAEWAAVVFALILWTGAWLRLTGRLEDPPFGDNKDELADLWNGWHLLHGAGPGSWTDLDFAAFYPETQRFFWFGSPFVVVKPYLDRPPLFSLLAGVASRAWSIPHYLFVPLERARLLPIALSLLCAVVVFLAGREAARRKMPGSPGDLGHREEPDAPGAALLGLLMFAVCPSAVLGSRLVKEEALLALLYVTAVWLSLREERRPSKAAASALGLIALLGPWTKEIGILAGLLPALRLFRAKDRRCRRLSGILVGLTLLSAGSYLAWGFALGGSVFARVLTAQASKPGGFDTIWNLAVGGAAARRHPELAGWTVALWGLAIASSVAAGRRRHAALALSATLYLLVIGVLVKPEAFDYYRIPFYPLLCAASGPSLLAMLRRPRAIPWLLLGVAVLWLPLSALFASPASSTVRLAVGLLALPFVIHEVVPSEATRRAARVTGTLVLFLSVAVACIPAFRIALVY